MLRCDVHNHTRYSNLRLADALPTPEQLIDRAIEIGLAGVAITDHEALCAHPKANKYYYKIKEQHPDFKVFLGDEIYLVEERPSKSHYHFIFLSKDEIGHKQLRMLSTLAWLNSYHSGLERVDTLKSDVEKIVKENPGHLIASTACIGGELGSRLLSLMKAEQTGDSASFKEEHQKIVDFILWCKDLFKDDFYIEVQPGVSKEQIAVNKRAAAVAKCFEVKMIATSDSHYLKKEDRYVHKSFLNSKEGEREVDAFYQDAYLHTNEEMIEKFKKSGFDEAFVEILFANTMEIYNKIKDYSLEHAQQIPKVTVKNYPKYNSGFDLLYPTLASLYVSDDIIERYWINECAKALKEKGLSQRTEYWERLEEEATIKKAIGEKLNTNIFAYPVTLKYYIDKFWELGSTVGAGRGSSCSGLNHWLLGVTQLDPIEWNLPFWRYLNKDRAELPDIDIDLAPSKRPQIIDYIKKERGQKFALNTLEEFKLNLGATLVATFGTETTKSAIQTACRGYRSEEYPDGIDVDTAQYMSSLVPSERGFLWSLKEVVEGNPEKDRKPVQTFINEVSKYPGLLDIMLGVEGNISRRGSHASGVIFTDEDPFEFMCFMRTPSGEVITQYDLHDAEWAGITKYDFLVTEVQDKITQTIELLQNDGKIEKELTLKQAYDKYLHPSVLPIEDSDVWKAIQTVSVLDLFQFDSDIGSQAAKKLLPSSIFELSDANGLMRLMTGDGGLNPMDKYALFKENIMLWYEEMDSYHLTKEEQETLKPHYLKSHGVPPSQEFLMRALMDEKICGFTLKEANDARKIIAKKQMNRIPELRENIAKKAVSPAMGKYIWECGAAYQLGYAFSEIHALAYSFIAYQTAYLATKFDPIYWNTACLIVNSGSLEDSDKGSDYAKIAKAIGSIRSRGIDVSLININTSAYGFKPDVNNNRILYGLKALSNISAEAIDKIIEGRPYSSIKDFMARCPLPKLAMINLIKAGAFDEIDDELNNNRVQIMGYYLSQASDLKKKITLQNFNGLIQYDLIPKELELQLRVFNFNKYLKTKKVGEYYTFDTDSIEFFERFFSDELDKLDIINNISCILKDDWDKIYKREMEAARIWIKDNQQEILDNYNTVLFKEAWKKYAKGTTSKWEMDSVCFYHGEHELSKVNMQRYGIDDFRYIPNEEIDYYFKKGNANIPIYKLRRIAGCVIAKNDTRHSISLLTTSGVVSVKFSGEHYAMFKKQISEVQPNGTKKVVEKGWFGRGNLLIIQGFRRDDQFVAKNYANSGGHQLYHIDEIIGDSISIRHERITVNNAIEEDEYVD